MSFRLPSKDHPARELMGDIRHIAELLDPANFGKLPTLSKARSIARETFKASPLAKRVTLVVADASNDNRLLVSFGPRGGRKIEWNFGDNRS